MCQTVWIQIRPDALSSLISVRTICKVQQQTTKFATVMLSTLSLLLQPLGTVVASGSFSLKIDNYQCRVQNAEKVAHIKGRLLDQAVLLFNCVPFQSGNFS